MSDEARSELDQNPDAPPAIEALKRWQEYYAALIDGVSRWAETRALIRTLPEAIPDALLMLDAAGAIVMVNNQLELMFGYHRSELIGQPPEMLLPLELRAKHASLRRGYDDAPRARNMAMAANLDFRVRRKNGAEFHVHVMLTPVATPDGVGTIAVIRRADLPERDSLPVGP